MKFTCKTSNLKEAISKIEKIVSKQITLPILANIHLSCENGRIAVSATNLEIAIKTFLGAKIEEPGEITIPARIMGGFLNSVKEDVVSGQVKGTELELTSESHRIKIIGMDAKDFPIIPKMPEVIFFKVKPNKLRDAIPSLLTSVAHNDTRQELNGINIKLEADRMILASTDSFRLSEAVVEFDETTEEYAKYIEKNPSIIVPALTLAELQRVINEDELSFVVEQNQLFIENSNFKIISRLINGNYPEYRQVLPKNYDISVLVSKSELADAVKIAALVTNNQNGEVKISNSQDKSHLIISSQSIDTGDNLSKIPAKIEGLDFEVIFNCRYLSDGLNMAVTGDDSIILKLNQQKSPVLLRSTDVEKKENEKFSYVVMPIIKS